TADRGSLTGLTPTQRFVQVLYLNALGRVGSLGEINAWVGFFNSTAGNQAQKQFAVANAIELSGEARTHLVKGWYLNYLGRVALGGEEQGWVNALLSGQTEETMLGGFLGTPEFFNRAQTLIASGTQNERFVSALYLLLLDRTPSAGEIQ